MGAGFGGMLFSLITGWIVDQYSFTPAFILFGIIPVIGAAIVWFLPETHRDHDLHASLSPTAGRPDP
jgi:ACS family hexuronate transporter-like MFS transporter